MKKENFSIKHLIILVFIILGFYLSGFFALIPINLFNMDAKNMSDSTNLLLSLFSNICFLGILVLIYFKKLKEEFFIFKKDISGNMDIAIKYWMGGLVLMAASNLFLNFVLNLGQAENEEIVQSMIDASPYIMLISAGLIGPIIEELVFRRSFRDAFLNKWVFALSSGLVFGALHVVTLEPSLLEYLFIIPYSALGISFALMYDKTKTVFTPIIMHIIHNSVLILLSFI